MVHTSNHYVAPGKKVWTWGNAEFGCAWDRNLTNEDGPYVELMAGAYTDNQPDFSWLYPYETKTFQQYWYPIQKIGPAKNANTEAAVNLEFGPEGARVGVCVTSRRYVHVVLMSNGNLILYEQVKLAPDLPYIKVIKTDGAWPENHKLLIQDADGKELIVYQPKRRQDRELPQPATEPPPPKEIETTEEIYLIGLHLEQCCHATRSPDVYWLEDLEREPENVCLNHAMGLVYLRKGEFTKAEEHFARAVRRLTFRNPNPTDGEPFYYLGLARVYLGKIAEAYEAFYKSTWNYAWQNAGNYALASISAQRDNLALALQQVETSLLTNT